MQDKYSITEIITDFYVAKTYIKNMKQTITLEQRIATINATGYPATWKARQIEGAKLTYERLAGRSKHHTPLVTGTKGYWPPQPTGDRTEDIWAVDMHPKE
jgi:hypothetical protein